MVVKKLVSVKKIDLKKGVVVGKSGVEENLDRVNKVLGIDDVEKVDKKEYSSQKLHDKEDKEEHIEEVVEKSEVKKDSSALL